jgi:hypothetical protein
MAWVVDEGHEVFTLGRNNRIIEERPENKLISLGKYWSWRGYP